MLDSGNGGQKDAWQRRFARGCPVQHARLMRIEIYGVGSNLRRGHQGVWYLGTIACQLMYPNLKRNNYLYEH